MADANLIADSLESVSLHLEAIRLLGDALSGVIEDSGTRARQYDFCLAFELLAEAAQLKLERVHGDVCRAEAFRADMNALSRAR